LKKTPDFRLPDFIGIGPFRTGSTWLHAVLKDYTNLPRGTKETNFFADNYRRGIEWYAWHFRDRDDSRPAGEIGPYFGSPYVPARIARHIPDCKIFCALRDPVDRAYSHYKLFRHARVSNASFEQSLAVNPAIAENSRYAFHLTGWQQQFGKENVLVTFYDDLRASPQSYVDSICDFIGIERISLDKVRINDQDFNRIETPAIHRRRARLARHLVERLRSMRAYRTIDRLRRVGFWDFCYGGGEPYGPLPPDVDARVRERFRPEITALEELVGRDLSAWKKPRVKSNDATGVENGIGAEAPAQPATAAR